MSKILKTTIAALTLAVAAASQAKEIIDIAGRSVDIPDNPERIVLGEGRMIYSVMLMGEQDPFTKIVGWRDDLLKTDPDTFNKLAEKFPKVKDLPQFGNPYADAIDLESLITAKPDIYLLNIGNYQRALDSNLIEKLEKAGIKTVFIDFRQKPLENTIPSMMILGDVFNAQAKAAEFNNYYRQHTAKIFNRVKGLKDDEKPTVFVWRAAGIDPNACCKTFGPMNYGRFVEAAGGINWGSAKFTGFGGEVNPEVLFSDPIDLIVATGANWSKYNENTNAVLLGYNESKSAAEEQLQKLFNKEGWSEINAVKNHKTYAIYHQFYNSPYHYIAIEALAKWIHPELFEDVDPEADFKELHDKFLPIDYSGTFWVESKGK